MHHTNLNSRGLKKFLIFMQKCRSSEILLFFICFKFTVWNLDQCLCNEYFVNEGIFYRANTYRNFGFKKCSIFKHIKLGQQKKVVVSIIF